VAPLALALGRLLLLLLLPSSLRSTWVPCGACWRRACSLWQHRGCPWRALRPCMPSFPGWWRTGNPPRLKTPPRPPSLAPLLLLLMLLPLLSPLPPLQRALGRWRGL
jgi:hypothetical protein